MNTLGWKKKNNAVFMPPQVWRLNAEEQENLKNVVAGTQCVGLRIVSQCCNFTRLANCHWLSGACKVTRSVWPTGDFCCSVTYSNSIMANYTHFFVQPRYIFYFLSVFLFYSDVICPKRAAVRPWTHSVSTLCLKKQQFTKTIGGTERNRKKDGLWRHCG